MVPSKRQCQLIRLIDQNVDQDSHCANAGQMKNMYIAFIGMSHL